MNKKILVKNIPTHRHNSSTMNTKTLIKVDNVTRNFAATSARAYFIGFCDGSSFKLKKRQ